MDFGRVTEKELDKIDFTLPADPAGNQHFLKSTAQHPQVYLGLAKWGIKEWVGKIYPRRTPATKFLDHYLKHYNSIELNTTHYRIYTPQEIQQWAIKAQGKEFRFCPKFPQAISHDSGFVNTEALTAPFLESIKAFGRNLGPAFLQVSEWYNPKQRDKLFSYLTSLPKDLQLFLEVRHKDWFADTTIRKELFDTLRALKMGAVITDTSGRRDCAHMELTVPKTFIRFVGNSLHKTDYARCNDWAERIKYWLNNGLQELYFFMHMHDETFSPELTVYLVDKLNAACGLHLHKPQFEQGSLFSQFGLG